MLCGYGGKFNEALTIYDIDKVALAVVVGFVDLCISSQEVHRTVNYITCHIVIF